MDYDQHNRHPNDPKHLEHRHRKSIFRESVRQPDA